ncbi:MAG: CPBP family intramembrane metalloprotease [Flavobacteriaceae bacterium]|nr:CPBP family intramembrane metalloprotease [Flavobacteriaceae bacterium]
MISSIKNTLDDLLLFLKKPKDQQDSNQTTNYKSNRLFSILAIDLLLAVVFMTIISLLEHFDLVNLEDHKSNELMQLPAIAIILVGALIIPFLEELIFRSYLRLKHNYLLQPLLYITSFTGKTNKEKLKTFIENNWGKFYTSIFYISALIFALVHLSNFEDINEILLFIPILIAPQFIVGLLAGYLRVKFGLLWGVILHGLHNLILLSLSLIFINSSINKANISNEKFILKIEEINNGNLNSKSSSFNSDYVYFENFKLEKLIALLLEKEEKFIEFNSQKLKKKRINLTFKKHSDSIDSKKVTLNELQKAYGFSITKSTSLDEVYNIQIKDSIKLNKNQQAIDKNSKTYVCEKEFKLENINLSQLTKILNSSYKQKFFFEGNSNDKYTFQFEKPKFVNLENVLYHKYGLILETNEKEIEYIKIDFDK